jgi:hypothetical protein
MTSILSPDWYDLQDRRRGSAATGGVEVLPNISKQSNDAIEHCSVMVHPHEGTFGGALAAERFLASSLSP